MEKLFLLERINQLLQVYGSRQAEAASSGAGRGKLLHKRLDILLIEIEWGDEDGEPEDDCPDKTPPLMAPNRAEHVVIILRERVYLLHFPFQFRVHIPLV